MNNNIMPTETSKKSNDYALYYLTLQTNAAQTTKRPVYLNELISEMAIPSEDNYSFYVLDKGIYISISDDAFVAVDEGADKENAHLYRISKEELEIAAAIENDDPNYIGLPGYSIIDPEEMMQCFIETVESDELYDKLHQALLKLDSFASILDALIDNKLLNTWFAFRDEHYRNVALNWCKQNQIEYTE